jgi:hypothetical protein
LGHVAHDVRAANREPFGANVLHDREYLPMTRAGIAPALCALAVALPASGAGVAAQTASPAPGATTLPEIGRVRATSAACAVLRDVAIPAVAASQRADARFGEMQTTMLPNFASVRSEYFSQRAPVKSDGIFFEAQFAHLSDNLTGQLQQLETMRKLLDDPRLAHATDPAIVAQRTTLEAVYAAQQERVRVLFAFLQRQAKTMQRNMVGWEDPDAIAKMNMPRNPDQAWERRDPYNHYIPPGMPVLTGFVLEDKERLNRWTTTLGNAVAVNEGAAQTVARAVARGCP